METLLWDGTTPLSETTAVRPHSIDLADFDGNGVIDVVCATSTLLGAQTEFCFVVFGDNSTGTPHWQENNPVAPDIAWFGTFPAVEFTLDIAIGNFDSDAELEIAVTKEEDVGQSNAELVTFEIDTSTAPVTVTADDVGNTIDFGSNIRAVNIDGAGEDELFQYGNLWEWQLPLMGVPFGSNDLGNVAWESNGTQLFAGNATSYTWQANPGNRATADVLFIDVDNDGDFELVNGDGDFGVNAGTLELFETPDLVTGNAASIEVINGLGSQVPSTDIESLAAGDFDGDGDQDIAVGLGAGGVELHWNSLIRTPIFNTLLTTLAPPVVPAGATSWPVNVSAIEAADVNGDGFDDLIVCEGQDVNFLGGVTNFNTMVIMNDGTSGPLALTTIAPQVLALPPIFPAGGLAFTNQQVTDIAAEDMDGDGDIDLALSRLNGPASVYINDGTGAFAHRGVAWDFAAAQLFNALSIDVGDINGDGVMDVVLGELTPNIQTFQFGTVVLGFQNVLGQITWPTFLPGGGLNMIPFGTGAGIFDVSVGDVDGDGLDDIAYSEDIGVTPTFGTQIVTSALPGVLLTAPHAVGVGNIVRFDDLIPGAPFNDLAVAGSDMLFNVAIGGIATGAVVNDVYVNTGGAIAALPMLPWVPATGASLTTCIDFADFNNDGLLDVIDGSLTRSVFGAECMLFDPLVPAFQPIANNAVITPNGASAVVACDFDGDGFQDFAVGSQGAAVTIHFNR